MAAKVIWLNEAVEDLEGIVRYIEGRSPSYASVVAARILETVEPLERFPGLGAAIREDSSRRHRHLICHSYRIIYRVEADYACIVAIVHGARQLPEDVLQRKRNP